ncbi:hypothetical protein [Limosilactobacillus reuteri]|uniref:hypothetical protein n=1 Tax=Limosilactobacillus reuteri TaxID=1598 RepID=UPI00177B42A5|nr:hypothetical protein [Limosilactobacillus reuteri]
MSIMNDLELKLKESENQLDQTQKTIRSIHQLLSSNENEASSDDGQPKRDSIEDKVIIRKMLAKKSAEGYTDQSIRRNSPNCSVKKLLNLQVNQP